MLCYGLPIITPSAGILRPRGAPTSCGQTKFWVGGDYKPRNEHI